MSGPSRSPEIPEPELLPSQLAVERVSDLLLGSSPQTQVEFPVPTADAQDVRAALVGSTLVDMLISPGAHLMPDPEGLATYSDLPPLLTPGVDADLTGVSISTQGFLREKTRLIDDGLAGELAKHSGVRVTPSGEGKSLVEWPGVPEWMGRVSLKFWYTGADSEERAAELVSLESYHKERGMLPALLGDVALRRQRAGYTIFNRAERLAANDQEVETLLAVIEALYHERAAAQE